MRLRRGSPRQWMGSYDSEMRYRLALAAVLVVVGVITAICIADSLDWIGRPFNGFLLGRNRIVAPIAQPSWPGARAGIPYWSQLVAVEGKPVDSVGEILAAAAAAGPGASLAYTFESAGDTVTLPVEVTAFTATDYLGLFANYLFNGLAFLLIGFFVAFLRPQQTAARAMLLFSLSWGFSLVLGLADFASFHFRELLALAEASAPASLLYLTLCFPTEHPLARRRAVRSALVGFSLVLGLLNIVLYDRAPRLWIVSYQLGLVGAAIAIVLAVACMWRQYRDAPNAVAREKIKIVFLGIVVAFACPAAAFAAGKMIGAELPLNVLPAATWVFPAALAYAIVKRDLFEIDVFLRRAASYVALSGAVFVLYVCVLGLFSHGFRNLSLASSPWFALLFSLAVLIVVRPLRDRLQDWVDRIFFRSRFDYVQITESLSHALTSTLDTREVSAQVEQAVSRTMAPAFCRLFHVLDDGSFRSGASDLELTAEIREQLETGRIYNTGRFASPQEEQLGDVSDSPLWKRGVRGDFETEPFEKIPLDPPFSKGEAGRGSGTGQGEVSIHDLFQGAALILPLRFEGRLEGLLVLGAKSSGAAYGPRDLELLRTVTNQAATALRNAASYRRVTELLASLESRVEERTRELQQTQAQLVQAEKMASLGTLVAGVAHEINNPLSFVSSSIDLISTSITEVKEVLDRNLRRNGGDGSALTALRDDLDYDYRIRMLEENAAICREGAERAARIVGDLRTFCRPGNGRREPTDLHASLEQCLRLLGGELKGRITVHRDYGELPRVRCDGGQMSQVFLNLLVNALQAIDGAGEVRVRTRRDDGVVRVEIEDSGRGMPSDVAARIFDPFFTTKEVGKGTGLGLSIVRSLVAAHGGEVAVCSIVGKGSVFTLTLPIDGADHGNR
jgi:signal transduction histidine kinase